jgi:phage minor structural protein
MITRLGDIDFRKKPVKPQLFLCKPNKEAIAKMNEAYHINFSQKLGALNELTFRLPVYIDKHHMMERNENADVIKGRYLVKLVLGKYQEYFIINQIEKIGQDEGEYLEIKSLSLGFELNDKIIRDYEVSSKTATQLLNDILIDTIWTIGYVDSEFDLKYRGLKVSSSTVLELVFEIAKTFNALIIWDTVNRKISFFRPENTGQDKGFKIKYGKYLEGLNQEDNAEEVITRLKLYGKEDISIREINPTGTTYIEDFTYFMYPYKETRNYTSQIYNSSDILNFWTYKAGDWIDSLGKIKLIATNQNQSIIINPSAMSAKNYKITATFRASNDDNVFGVIVRYQDQNNYYYVGYNSGKINGGLGWSPNNLRIYKVINGVHTLLAQTDKIDGWSQNNDYNITVEVNNDLIKVLIENRLVLYTKDNSFPYGAYGFFGQNQQFTVSNVKVQNKEYIVLEHSDYMSDELCHAILDYNELLQENKSSFETLRGMVEAYQGILDVKKDELSHLNTQLKILLDERDVLNTRIAQMEDAIDDADNRKQDTALLESDLQVLKNELNVKLLEIKAKEAEISAKEAEIVVEEQNLQGIENKILALKVLLDVKNNFTKELLDERNQYIIEKEWQDNNITDPKDLLEAGIKVFNEYKQQKITLKVDVVNFLSMVTEQRNWDKLDLGDTITIEHERLQIAFKAKITEVEYDFEDSKINITISNVKDLYANKDKFLEMLYKSYNSSTQVTIDSWKWDLSLENKGSINEIINNIWDANKRAIMGAKDQVIEISDRGLIIRDPNDPMNYLVGLNSMIAITNDGGATWKHAITSTGIVGERIYGKVIMGVNLAIEDEHGIVKWQGSKGEIFDRNGKLVMNLGLVQENPDCFGMMAFNDITRVKVTDCEGFAIERANPSMPNGWEKILWADQSDGTLYSHDLVAQNIKIVNDIGELIMDAENHYLNIGDFNNIVMDNKLTTMEKMQLITELYKIHAGYKRMLEQAEEYKRSTRDDIVDTNSQFLTKTPSTVDRLSTAPLTNAYTDLINYMSQYIKVLSVDPLNIDVDDPMTEQTSEIPDRAEFILKFKTYYDEEKKLRNAIEDSMFYTGLNMGKFYNNIVIGNFGFIALRNDGKYRAFLNATNGLALQKWEHGRWVNKVYASIGNPEYEDGTLIAEDLVAKRLRIETKYGDVLLDFDSLNLDFTVLDSIILDNVIMSPEKITLLNQFKSITQQYNTLKQQISRYATTIYNDRDSSYYGLDTAKDALVQAGAELDSAYNELSTYMAPVFANMNAKTHVVNDLHSSRTEFHLKWENFYKKYENARNKLNDFMEKSSLQLGRNYNNTVIDAQNGIVVTRGNKKNRVTMNATEGIKIERNDGTASSPNWTKVFYVDLDGELYAVGLNAEKLNVKSARIGDGIILDEITGITINGQNGEQIRLNANEGIAIDVYGEPRLWIHTDGTLRAKKLIITDTLEDPIPLPDGSFISRLTVTSVRTLESTNPQDYVFVKDQFIKFVSGDGSGSDQEKMAIFLDSPSGGMNGIPVIKMGYGSGMGANEVGYIIKDDQGFHIKYKSSASSGGYERKITMPATGADGIVVDSKGGSVKLTSDTKIRIEVNASNYIEITPSGVKIVGSRIDLN